MFKKSDIFPLVLALISTLIVLALGFLWLGKISINNSEQAQKDTVHKNTKTKSTTTTAESSPSFAPPTIVPQGTSVRINGSTRMIPINQVLKKSFQRQFPGTAIITDSDGTETSLELLRSGEIELAGISRNLTKKEQNEGLVAVAVDESVSNTQSGPSTEIFYYVYREPVVTEVETFLGFALSPKGQQTIVNR